MIFDENDEYLVGAKTTIKVIGVGGAGKNAVDHMIENNVDGVEFVAVNTDAQDLKACHAENKLLIGKAKTHGRGAGANPDVGRAAAIESEDDIHEMMGDTEMVFVTCGMGGGTGTGAAPVIAKIAHEHGCLTVGICTKPFHFEGPIRMKNAEEGLKEIKKYVDTLIVIPNERLLSIIDPSTPLLDAYREVDNVLRKGVQSISDIINFNGLTNLDFADVRSVMENKGTALMGIGVASGANRAVVAARKAITSQLLEVSIAGATDALVNFTASENIALSEITAAINEIRNVSGNDLNIIQGTAINNGLGDEIVVTVVATGFEAKAHAHGVDDFGNTIIEHDAADANIDMPFIWDMEDITEFEEKDTKDINELFSDGVSEKEAQRQKKIEEKARKKEEAKKNKKGFSFFGRKKEDPVEEEDTDKDTNLPDWL